MSSNDTSASDAFALDYQDHHDAVAAVAGRICGAQHAGDVAQEVFLALWDQPDTFDPDRGSRRAFLLALAHNKAVDVIRRETARTAREERVNAAEPTPSREIDVDLLRADAAARIRAALDGLPAKEQAAIGAAFYGLATYRDAAARLGVAEGTVKSRIRSGLQRLRPELADLSVGAGAGHRRGSAAPVRAAGPR